MAKLHNLIHPSNIGSQIRRDALSHGVLSALEAACHILDWSDECWGKNSHRMRIAALNCVATARDNMRELEGVADGMQEQGQEGRTRQEADALDG